MEGTTITTEAEYVNGIKFDQIEDYVYLGQRFALIEKNQDNEIRRMIKARWQAFRRHITTIKGTLPTCLKGKDFNQCILTSMTYGTETRKLTTKWKRNCLQHNTTWNEKCLTSLIMTEILTSE